MELIYIIIAAILLFFLSFANGANDVSKAIATLAGSGLSSVRTAIAWGTLWTVIGAMSGIFWGGALIKNISESIYIQKHEFILASALAVAIAPILWVSLATWRKWAVSTTHAVVGGLLGTGLIAYGINGINWDTIFTKIALPLFVSPFIAIFLAFWLTPYLERIVKFTDRLRICLTPMPKIALVNINNRDMHEINDCLICSCDSPQATMTHGFALSVNNMHWLTSGLLSFSRGLNDSPKLIAIVLPFLYIYDGVPIWFYIWGGIAMGLGSWFAGKNITEVLGFKLTKMNHEQGFSANLISTFLVIGASKFGLPVSTTHVSSSSIMGVGLVNNQGLNMQTVISMLFAWLVTVPISGMFAMLVYLAFI
ncbi:MAG: PiT family inorganic phosphate transporter [Gammaproteobacteria bacterium]|jgi:PiT family inorganic phosphate transporter